MSSSIETNALVTFSDVVNNVIRSSNGNNTNPISEATALKFLLSRKFDVQRALDLYRMHEIVRLREGLSTIDCDDENLKLELESHKFTILRKRDPNNSAIAVFTAKLHEPTKSSKNLDAKKKIHRITLQGIVYQLDAALDDITTQRNGVVFIYNMSDSDYSNFDYELCQKILNLLKGAYPAKLKKVLIVSPPLWFRAPFHLLRLIVREKLRDRVWLLNKDQLLDHLPADSLTPELGGTYLHDHLDWLNQCILIHKAKNNDLCDPIAAQHLTDTFNQNSVKNFRRLSSIDFDKEKSFSSRFSDNNSENQRVSKSVNENKKQDTERFDYDDTGLSLVEFAKKYRENSKLGLAEEYNNIREKFRPGSNSIAMTMYNARKNRYINILPFDHTRVILEPYDLPEAYAEHPDNFDYINACHIDGYRQPKAYISTQGPLADTSMDFWRMIWQSNCRVIAMFALVIENGSLKCHQYWPTADEPVIVEGVYKIEYLSMDWQEDFIVTNLNLTNTRLGVTRSICHFQYISWPDFGTPTTASALLKFRDYALKKQLDAIELCGPSSYPPLVVHCSAGVGRTGTFITIDISIQKLETTGLVDVESVVDKLRYQRKDSIQTSDQYIFCYKAVLEYAISCKLLSESGQDELN